MTCQASQSTEESLVTLGRAFIFFPYEARALRFAVAPRSLYDVDPVGSTWTKGDWKLFNIRSWEGEGAFLQ